MASLLLPCFATFHQLQKPSCFAQVWGDVIDDVDIWARVLYSPLFLSHDNNASHVTFKYCITLGQIFVFSKPTVLGWAAIPVIKLSVIYYIAKLHEFDYPETKINQKGFWSTRDSYVWQIFVPPSFGLNHLTRFSCLRNLDELLTLLFKCDSFLNCPKKMT